MELPKYENLEVSKLTSVFSDTTNSYKFYWFLSILDILQESNNNLISVNDITLRMVASVWYPLDYFKLSFGKNDGFKSIAKFITDRIKVDNNPNTPSLIGQLNTKLPTVEKAELNSKVNNLINYVPFRFVRPFFSEETRAIPDYQVNNKIKALLEADFNNAPQRVIYKFKGDFIVLNAIWKDYFQQHQGILRGFINWHLIKFLQKNNPNVFGLSEKLEKPVQRDLKVANMFWKEYLKSVTHIKCIYSGQEVSIKSLSLDHFLPWSLVAHDLIWNIIPTPKSVNSTKSDRIPSIDLYLNQFIKVQFDAFQFHSERGAKSLLEDYSFLFGQTTETILQKNFDVFSEGLTKQILPQIQTGRNMGFDYPFIYKI